MTEGKQSSNQNSLDDQYGVFPLGRFHESSPETNMSAYPRTWSRNKGEGFSFADRFRKLGHMLCDSFFPCSNPIGQLVFGLGINSYESKLLRTACFKTLSSRREKADSASLPFDFPVVRTGLNGLPITKLRALVASSVYRNGLAI